MNFLLNALEGGADGDGDGGGEEDGWDDDFGDLSDQSLEDNEEEEVNDRVHANAPSQPPQQHQQQQHGSAGGQGRGNTLSMGGGMFMGRLTQFIDAVTQPDDDEEQDYDDDEEDRQDGDGWDDDLGFDEDEDGDGQAGGGDDSDDGHQNDGDGWDEDDLNLSLDSPVKPPAEQSDPPPPPPAAPPAPAPPQQTQTATAPPLNARTPDAIIPLNDVTEEHVVDHTPPAGSSSRYNRNVSFDACLAVVGSVQTLDDNIGTSTVDAVEAPSGWEENDDGLDDLDLEEDGDDEQQPKILDHTPSEVGPTPTISTSTSSAAAGTNVAIADSTAQSSGWDEDEDDGLFDDIEVDGANDTNDSNNNKDTKPTSTTTTHIPPPVQMLDHTPPPPPPPPAQRENSLTVSFGGTSRVSVLTNAWDDTDGDLDNIDNNNNADDEEGKTQMVDVTPPPPPPPRQDRGPTAGASEIAIAAPEDGWDDDEDILEDANSDVTPVVDHTPPPPPPPPSRSSTNAAILGDDDDISRDDTLSVDNSKSNLAYGASIGMTLSDDGSKDYQANMVDRTPSLLSPVPFKRQETAEAVRSGVSLGSSTLDEYRQSLAGDSSDGDGTAPSTNVVDHTPSLATNPENQSAVDPSLVALAGGTESLGESLGDSLDNSRDPRTGELRLKGGKMVDHTPLTRFSRQADASLAVAGHTSVGESLDSIDEAGEEAKSDQAMPTSTPGRVELGWGGAIREDYNISIQNASSEIPFGSAVTPTAAGSSRLDSGDGSVPMVDHTPPTPLVKSQSIANSVVVLSVSSEEGDLGESDDGVDSIKDDLYGQVVDHTPETPGQATQSQSGVKETPSKQEDDTVFGVASRNDVEFDLKQDEGMDDESSKGTQGTGSIIGTLEDTEVRSLLGGSSRLAIVEEKKLVDHVPETDEPDSKGQRQANASTMVLADASSGSSEVDDNVVNDDDTTPAGFGPIVDHTPGGVMHRSVSARSVSTSVATQNSGLETDIKMDEEMDNTVVPGGATDSGESDRQSTRTPLPVVEENHLVDRVPKRRQSRQPHDASVRVLVDNNDDLTQVDTIAEEEVVNFGPIVDQTPFSATRSSGASLTQGSGIYGVDGDTKPDDDMDTMTAPGASLDGASGWDHDEADLEEISGMNGTPANFPGEESNLVDHVPRRSFARPTDASLAVVFDPNDAVSQADDNDTNAPNNNFGPVVDHTPLTPGTQHAVSVAQSMLTQANGVATDIQDEDGMDGTWFGASMPSSS